MPVFPAPLYNGVEKQMKPLKFLLLFVVCLSFASPADAFIFRRWRRTSTVQTSWPSNISSSDQARAQHKANVMANRGVMSHGVAPMVGSFEGIGYGGSRNCGTCTPRGRMTLTADAAAFSSSTGRWYRVRAWR